MGEHMKIKIKKLTKKIKTNLSKQVQNLNLKDKKFNALELCLIIIMALITGVLAGEVCFSNGKTYKTSKEIREIQSVYNTLLNDYYGDLNGEKLEEAAINGMMSLLGDKYSNYFDTETAEKFNEELDGTFTGIGIEVTNDADGVPTILTVIKDTPASKAGLKEGDKIIKLDNEDVSKMKVTELVKKIKGTNKVIELLIKRNEEEIKISFSTGKIEIQSVTKQIFEKENKKIGYIGISIFALNTDEQFEKALLELEQEGIDSLIIDVRNNSGGHLETVVNIASLFIDKDNPICQIKTKEKTNIIKSTKKTDRKYNVVVLVNKSSASASELLAGALKEIYNSDIIGETTYGKGTVQKTMTLSNGSMIKYTAETWLTAKGNSIDKIGISPTIEVLQDENYYSNPSTETDKQLQKAIEVLNK